MKNEAYAEALSSLTHHDPSRPFILCLDAGTHAKAVCSANLRFISMTSAMLLKDVVSRSELDVNDTDEFLATTLAHVGLSRWRLFGVMLLAVWRGQCRDQDCAL